MFSSGFCIKFCRFIKWSMLTCTGFPQLDLKGSHRLSEFLERAPQSTRAADWFAFEVNEYLATIASKRNSRKVMAFVLINLLLIFKYFYHVLLVWFELDFIDFEKNIKSLGHPTGMNTSFLIGEGNDTDTEMILGFMCLRTNCTQLSELSDNRTQMASSSIKSYLAADLKYLPIFSLCHPSLSNFYSPCADSGHFSIVVDLYVPLFCVVLCVIFPVQQIWNKANNESLMFIVAPNLSIRMLCHQLERMLEAYDCSLRCFLDKIHRERQIINGGCPLTKLELNGAPLSDATAAAAAAGGGGGQRNSQLLDRTTCPVFARRNSTFVNACLPIVRTNWWHKRIAYLYFCTFVVFVCIVLLPMLIVYGGIIIYKMYRFQERLLDIDSYVRKVGCAIWHEGDGAAIGSIRLAEINVFWTLWDVVVAFVPLLWIVYILTSLQSLIFIISCELSCWLKEVRQNLLLLTDLIRVKNLLAKDLQDYCRITNLCCINQGEPLCQHAPTINYTTTDCVTILRELLISQTKIRGILVEVMPFGSRCLEKQQQQQTQFGDKLNNIGARSQQRWSKSAKASQVQLKVAQEKFAYDLLICTEQHRHQVPYKQSMRSPLIELTEKIYLNYQLLIKLVGMYSRNLAVLILLANLGAYGAIVSEVAIAKLAPEIAHLAYPLVSYTLIWIFIAIILVSSFHAESRKLQPLFWSLIAQITEQAGDEDIELRYLRDLLIKQTSHIDSNGGMAMSAFNFRVTYTNVIQLFVYLSSLLALSLKDY